MTCSPRRIGELPVTGDELPWCHGVSRNDTHHRGNPLRRDSVRALPFCTTEVISANEVALTLKILRRQRFVPATSYLHLLRLC